MGITAFDCKSMIRAERGGRLRLVRAVRRAVLDGNAKVFGRDCVRRVEFCDGARDFQNAVVRAGGKPEARDCSFEPLFAFGVDRAVLADESGRHLSVRVDAFFAREAFGLAGARADHALADRGGAFDDGVAAQLFVFYGGDVDVDVDAVKQRPGNF